MRTFLVLALALGLVAFVGSSLVAAQPPKPFCVGYQDCYQTAGDGWALFCVQNPKNAAQWWCGECESCGNGPWLP